MSCFVFVFVFAAILSLACHAVKLIPAHSVTRSTAIQRFLYGNAGFSKLTSIDGLSTHRWRFDV